MKAVSTGFSVLQRERISGASFAWPTEEGTLTTWKAGFPTPSGSTGKAFGKSRTLSRMKTEDLFRGSRTASET